MRISDNFRYYCTFKYQTCKKNKMKKTLFPLLALVVAGITFNSCLKESKSPEPGYNVIETGVNATQIMEAPMDVYLQADRAIRLQRDSIIYKHINQSTFTFNIGYISL